MKPTNEYVLSNIKAIRPERKTLAVAIEAPGYLTYDSRVSHTVAARFAGRIERLLVRYPLQYVQKGQHLLDLYSPEMATAQQEYILLLERDPGNTVLIENARNRLLLLGFTEAQLQVLEVQRKPSLSIPVFSPYSGLVMEQNASRSTLQVSDMNPEMGSKSPQIQTGDPKTDLFLREGKYVEKGQRLFTVQSLNTVWAILEFYPSDRAFVKVGQPVRVRIEPFKDQFFGKIDYIEPQFAPGNNNLRARVYLKNPGGMLKPGALLTATVQGHNHIALWIPRNAVLQLGRQSVVFLKQGAGFQSKKIKTGVRVGEWLEVLSGLTEADETAADAQFLMDSESFLKITD